MARSRRTKHAALSVADAVAPPPAEPAAALAPAPAPVPAPPLPAPVPEIAPMASDTSPAEQSSAEGEGERHLSFGQFLVHAREQKRLTLDDMAHLTKIRRAILDALERDARKELPEKVFVLGYVRSYASNAGLNVEDTLRRFNQAWADDEALPAGEEEATKSRSLAWLPPTIASILAILAVWFIVTHLR